MTALLGASAGRCSLSQRGSSVCPASCRLRSTEQGRVRRAGSVGARTFAAPECCSREHQGDAELTGVRTPRVGWDALHGSYWRFLTWCVSPRGVSRGVLNIRGQIYSFPGLGHTGIHLHCSFLTTPLLWWEFLLLHLLLWSLWNTRSTRKVVKLKKLL